MTHNFVLSVAGQISPNSEIARADVPEFIVRILLEGNPWPILSGAFAEQGISNWALGFAESNQGLPLARIEDPLAHGWMRS